MRRYCLGLMVAVFLWSSSLNAYAQTSSWQEDKAAVEEMVEEGLSKNCQQVWDILWHWSKQGNLEARELLFSATTMPENLMLPPGTDHIVSARMQDIYILLVHAAGAPQTKGEAAKSYMHWADMLHEHYMNGIGYDGNEWFRCMQREPSQQCTAILVKDKAVPSFSDYADRIDLLEKNGLKPTCEDNKTKKR